MLPIEWTVKITDVEVNTLKDDSMEIRYEKVFEWCLPMYGDDEESLFEYQAASMRNYMRKGIVEDGWTPKFYSFDNVIKADHVARFYGACLCKMLMGNRSIEHIFCIKEIFNAVPSIQASITKKALEDLTGCLHYSDDWELMGAPNWDDICDDPKVEADASMASHRVKHGILEDGYNRRWQAMLILGSG
jgi:hypothetical protein